MNCQRCLRAEKAVYRAYSDIIDLKVCAVCASEAWWFGLSIEVLDHRPTLQQRRLTRPNRFANAGRSKAAKLVAIPARADLDSAGYRWPAELNSGNRNVPTSSLDRNLELIKSVIGKVPVKMSAKPRPVVYS